MKILHKFLIGAIHFSKFSFSFSFPWFLINQTGVVLFFFDWLCCMQHCAMLDKMVVNFILNFIRHQRHLWRWNKMDHPQLKQKRHYIMIILMRSWKRRDLVKYVWCIFVIVIVVRLRFHLKVFLESVFDPKKCFKKNIYEFVWSCNLKTIFLFLKVKNCF